MLDYVKELEKIEGAIASKKMEKVRLEERKKAAEAEISRLDAEINSMVPEGKKLAEFMASEQQAIQEGISECQAILKQI